VKPGVVRKAINAGVTAGMTALSVVITGGGSVAITDLTSAQWTAIGFGALYAGWSTYAIPNDGGDAVEVGSVKVVPSNHAAAELVSLS
jgi:hypothetical protein